MTLCQSIRPNHPLRRGTILLVEDEPFVREATRSILAHAGFEVLPAENASEAMQIYEQRNCAIDLLMTDLILPGCSGEQLARNLRARSPEVAVLVTSGYDNPDYETGNPEASGYFLAKPYSRQSLIEKIEKILALAPLRRAATQAG
ncbi:MAG: response regulator [Terriglobales bacterium]|jgi:DNA-binding NtrC family response regulator